jgi:hypothetical protein
MVFDLSKLRTGHAAGSGSSSLARRILNIADLPDIHFGHLVPENSVGSESAPNPPSARAVDLSKLRIGRPGAGPSARDLVDRAFDLSKLRFGHADPDAPGPITTLSRRDDGSGPGKLPVGLIIAFVAAGIAALLMIFLIVVPFFERRKEKARIAREGKPGDIEAPKPADVQFTRSGADLLPVAPGPQMLSRGEGGLTVQMAPRPSLEFSTVSLVTPVSRKGPANPFTDPTTSPPRMMGTVHEKDGFEEVDVGKESMGMEGHKDLKEEDPFADEVAAMQERLKEKFSKAQGQYKK